MKEVNIQEMQNLLDYILSVWQPNGGYTVSAKNYIAFHELLASIDSNDFNELAVHKTLTEMKTNSQTSLDDFQNIYLKIRKELSRKKSINNKWIFYIPIEVEFEDNIKFPISITLLGKQYHFIKNYHTQKNCFLIILLE